MLTREFMDLTNFYYPGKRGGIRFSNYKEVEDSSHEPEDMSDDNSNSDDHVVGFVGSGSNDRPYADLIEHTDDELGLEPALPLLKRQDLSELEECILKNKTPMFFARKEQLPITTKSEVIVSCCFKNISTEKQAAELGISPEWVENIIYEFTTLKRITNNTRRSLWMKRQKVKERHVASLAEFVQSRGIKGFSLSDAKLHLENQFSSLRGLDLSTVSRLLRNDLGLSFKKLGGTNVKKVYPDSKNNLISWVKAIISMLIQRCKLVFIDEFIINRKTQNTYGWTQSGKPGRLLIRAVEFKMSFVVAHSQAWVEGIMGTKSSFNQEKYSMFLKELIAKLKTDDNLDWEKLILIADNWAFHRTNAIKELLSQEKLTCLFIPPYSPEINACEKLINFIKSRVKAMVNEQR